MIAAAVLVQIHKALSTVARCLRSWKSSRWSGSSAEPWKRRALSVFDLYGKGVEDGKGEEKEGATNLAYFEPSQGVTT